MTEGTNENSIQEYSWENGREARRQMSESKFYLLIGGKFNLIGQKSLTVAVTEANTARDDACES